MQSVVVTLRLIELMRSVPSPSPARPPVQHRLPFESSCGRAHDRQAAENPNLAVK